MLTLYILSCSVITNELPCRVKYLTGYLVCKESVDFLSQHFLDRNLKQKMEFLIYIIPIIGLPRNPNLEKGFKKGIISNIFGAIKNNLIFL